MKATRRNVLLGCLIVGAVALGLLSSMGLLLGPVLAQENPRAVGEPPEPPRPIPVPPSATPPSPAPTDVAPLPSIPDPGPTATMPPPLAVEVKPPVPTANITDLMNNLAGIRAKQAELAKAEKDVIAGIRAKLQQQKDELNQLEKRLRELGIEPEQANAPPPPPSGIDPLMAAPSRPEGRK